MIGFIYDDGGRADAGYKGDTHDCVCRAAAIATGKPYQEIYDQINNLGARERRSKRKSRKSHARTGVYKATTRKLMEQLGWRWTPTMQVGSGCKVHLRADELPPGRLVVQLSKHTTAVINGVVHDTFLDDRGGTRCVYGYWSEVDSAADAEPEAPAVRADAV
jgi:hypothetical protein